jgi:cytochrome c biogenesis protein CcmG/thiol:disulfide interchange protein DsbE
MNDTPSGFSYRVAWIVAPVAVVMLVFIVLLATRGTAGDGDNSRDLTGQLAPALAGATLDGGRFDIDDHRGQFVIVNFFQTTCVPCIEEHPELVAFQEANVASGRATIVSVAFDDSPDAIRKFFDEQGGDWPIIAEATAELAIDYAVTAVPESIVVAPTGEVVIKARGGVEAASLEAVMASWEAANQ